MRTAPRWIRRGLLVALVAAAGALLAHRLESDDGLGPAIGGDTWPPVPVKPVPPG